MTYENGNRTVSIPARLLLDLLARRIPPERFPHFLGDRPGEVGLFEHLLNIGSTLNKVEMAERDVDEDDDHVVFHFSDDPAARKLRIKQQDG